MQVVNLEQRGPQWLKWRQEGIGGSDACVLMGDVNWSNPSQLMAQKLGIAENVDNERMKRGRELEPRARQLYELLTGRTMRPICVIHDKYPWLRASLDGISDDHQIVLEIKCPSENAHRKALRGTYPYYYRAQLQHQLLITEAPTLHYWSFTDSETFPLNQRFALVVVRPEPEYQAKLFKKAERFMKGLRSVEPADFALQELPDPEFASEVCDLA